MDDDQERELEALEGILSDPNAEPIRLSYGLLKFITDNFSHEIGRGGFAVVYQGNLQNGVVAVKRSNGLNVTDKQFMDEIKCLKSANHRNIVRFLGYCADTQEEVMPSEGTFVMAGKRNRLLCFEYVSNGNIRQYLQQEKPHRDNQAARYQMIRGICQGLHYLHEKQINHLDLKPENVMLDAHMEPKITDFGLSRFLDQGESKMITQHIVGTLRYIAPEIIDKGEISFKSDIYALGIIIIELLTGVSMISLQNWDDSLDVLDCPRMKMYTEIARNCTDTAKDKRPTIREVIRDLDELESMTTRSPLNQLIKHNAFPGTELLDVYPLKLIFPFKLSERTSCSVSLINKTSNQVGFLVSRAASNKTSSCLAESRGSFQVLRDASKDALNDGCPVESDDDEATCNVSWSAQPHDRFLYSGDASNNSCSVESHGIIEPMSTLAIMLSFGSQLEPPLEADREGMFEVVMFIMRSPHDFWELMSSSVDNYHNILKMSIDDLVKNAQEQGGNVHRAILKAVIVVQYEPEGDDSASDDDDDDDNGLSWTGPRYKPSPDIECVGSGIMLYIEVHPTEPWVLVFHDANTVYIWDLETKERIYERSQSVYSAKFIARRQWLVIGGSSGSIFVHTCPVIDQANEFKTFFLYKEFEAHSDDVTSLAVHPTRPILLSYSLPYSLKLWDWDQDWSCVGIFDSISDVTQLTFNPKDTNSFSVLGSDKRVKVWKIDNLNPTIITGELELAKLEYISTRGGSRHLVTVFSHMSATIWDLHKRKCVHTFSVHTDSEIVSVAVYHPTCQVLVTASDCGTIHVWDCVTYRHKKTYVSNPEPVDIGFIGSRRNFTLHILLSYESRITQEAPVTHQGSNPKFDILFVTIKMGYSLVGDGGPIDSEVLVVTSFIVKIHVSSL